MRVQVAAVPLHRGLCSKQRGTKDGEDGRYLKAQSDIRGPCSRG